MRERMCPVVSLLGRVFRLDCQAVVTSDGLPYRQGTCIMVREGVAHTETSRSRIVRYASTILQSDERDTSVQSVFTYSRLFS